MRTMEDATKISKAVTKILGVLEKENLTDEQLYSVIKITQETLGLNKFPTSVSTTILSGTTTAPVKETWNAYPSINNCQGYNDSSTSCVSNSVDD